MNLSETRGSQANDYAEAGPIAARVLLGARLRKLREDAGVSRKDAGYALRGSESKISRLELGRIAVKLRDVSDLLDLYRAGEDERATLLAMAGSASAPAWWQQYGDAVPGWLATYLGLEQAAEVIRCYGAQFVPDLLQTREYARAVFQIEADNDPGLDTGQQVSVRMGRQRILRRPRPPRLWAVLDEGALRRVVGGPDIMRAQLRHLIEISSLPTVALQVLPFAAGAHPAKGGAFTILRFSYPSTPDVVFAEHLTSASYLSMPGEAGFYWKAADRLAMQALPPASTTAFIEQVAQEMETAPAASQRTRDQGSREEPPGSGSAGGQSRAAVTLALVQERMRGSTGGDDELLQLREGDRG